MSFLMRKSKTKDSMELQSPVLEAPVLEAPVLESPVLESPVLEAPVLESPVLESPVLESPVLEAPNAESPNPESPEPQPQVLEMAEPQAPPSAASVAETGLDPNNLIKLVLKIMYVRGTETARAMSEDIKLHVAITTELLEQAKDQSLVNILRSVSAQGFSDFRYALSAKGREWAVDAMRQNQYVGPAPVSLKDYLSQIRNQAVYNEPVFKSHLQRQLSGLVVPPTLESRLGPAINSRNSLLLYGAPGNGKSTIAQAIAGTFKGYIYVPYCIEVDGEIIKVLDPLYHVEIAKAADSDDADPVTSISRAEYTDRRWVACRRPVIMAGGELTLEMLNMHFSTVSRYYEAPLHVKANGGTFIIDDLGRHMVSPTDLLNRWIIPMERRVDYMALQNGTTFEVPFDNFLIFSTNMEPSDLMDAAFLRRIPYKVEVRYPTDDEFRMVFENVCREYGLQLNDEVVAFSIREIQSTHDLPLAFYQPKFIVQQVVAACGYQGREADLDIELVREALENMSAKHAEAA